MSPRWEIMGVKDEVTEAIVVDVQVVDVVVVDRLMLIMTSLLYALWKVQTFL